MRSIHIISIIMVFNIMIIVKTAILWHSANGIKYKLEKFYLFIKDFLSF